MKKILKISGIIVGGFVLLAIVISLIPGGDKKLEQINTNLKQTNEQLEAKVQEQVTTQITATPTTTPVVNEKKWLVVKEFSGSGDVDKTTENFQISGTEWKISWSY